MTPEWWGNAMLFLFGTNLSNNGFTALMRAFVNRHTDVVDLLRQAGARS
jgi:ankyrin repeat protein